MTDSWDDWKKTLAAAVEKGQSAGMDQDDLVSRAETIGDVLAEHADPQNPQQKLLKELWSNADANEQQALASTIVKMVQQ